MNTDTLILVVGFLVLVGLAISYKTLLKIYRILSTPTCNINALPWTGTVEVVGQAGDKTCQSPISMQACVLWQVEVQEKVQRGRNSRWVTVYQDCSKEPFEVSDETGKISIKPTGAEIVLHNDLKDSSGLFSGLDPQSLTYVHKLGLETTNILGLRNTMRIYERYVSTQETIYIMGVISNADAQKTITSGIGSSFIISDRSERGLLVKFFGRVALNVFFTILIGGPIILVILINYFKMDK
jgi:hypothetical protein